MIITRTPFRISFFGGGTDYPDWYRMHGGAVLSTTINKYCYISCRYLPPFFAHKHRIVYSLTETVNHIDEIKHPAVKAVLNWVNAKKGLEIHYNADLPARSGLGSSSAFTVGLLHALASMDGHMSVNEQLAHDAIHIEQEVIGEHVGSQDQISASYGGFNRIVFHRDDTYDVSPVMLPQHRRAELNDHLMLCFTGFSRIASEVAQSKINNFKSRELELMQMREMVDEGLKILHHTEIPIDEFGKLLHESWLRKRNLSDRVSNPAIDAMYAAALDAGALGGKILGAGGGGFLLFFAKPDRHAAIRERLNTLVHVPFQFEQSGSRVLVYQPQGF